VILLLRRSNTSEGLATQIRRALELARRREARLPRGTRYTRLHLVTLDVIKGTEAVPVRGYDRGPRAIYVKTVEREVDARGDAVDDFDVPLRDDPQGDRTPLAFVDELVLDLVGDHDRCDVLIPAISRVCLRGALEAFGNLFLRRRVSVFSWDLWRAALVSDEIKAMFMDDDFRLRVEEPEARRRVEEIARGDRMWRFANAFQWPIWL